MVNEQLLRFFQGFHHKRTHGHGVRRGRFDGRVLSTTPPTSTRGTGDLRASDHREAATIAARPTKHTLGQPFVYRENDLRYCANMLNMFFAVPCEPYCNRSGSGRSARSSVHSARGSRTKRQHVDGAAGRQHRRESLTPPYRPRIRSVVTRARRRQ